MAQRSSFSLGYLGQVISLPPDRSYTIGRSSECDLVLDDARVSRLHAKLRIIGDRLILEVVAESGVFLNAKRLSGGTELRRGDQLTVGRHTFVVLGSRAAPSMIPTMPPPSTIDAGDVKGDKPRQVIAIVDDSASIREVVKRTLTAEGYTVLTANTPFEATGLIERERPDLVLLDVGMPGLSGDQIVRFVRTRQDVRDTRIVFYSARSVAELEQLTSQCDADGFIRKSSDPQDLIGAVRAWASPWEP